MYPFYIYNIPVTTFIHKWRHVLDPLRCSGSLVPTLYVFGYILNGHNVLTSKATKRYFSILYSNNTWELNAYKCMELKMSYAKLSQIGYYKYVALHDICTYILEDKFIIILYIVYYYFV